MRKEIIKNGYVKVAVIFVITFSIFYGLDFAFKTIWFDKHLAETFGTTVQHDWKVIGIRSLAHGNSTLFSSIHLDIADWGHHLMAFGLAAIFMVWLVFYSRSKLMVVSLSIIVAGILGNGVDRIFHGYVRDIFFLPYWDRGTFNFADVILVVGALMTLIAMFREMKLFDGKKRKAK